MTGLTSAEAARRLSADGPNELPSARPISKFAILIRVVWEPMIALLVVCGALYLIIGEPREGVPLLLSIFLVIGIGLTQELKAERALEALRQLSSPRALVIRDGQAIRVAGAEVVMGDLIALREGDRVAADATLLEASHLRVDESLLTGESFPVRKRVDVASDEARVIRCGSLVVAGRGLARVTATGARTEIGKLGASLREPKTERSPLQREVSSIVRSFGILGIGTSVLVVLAYGLTRGDWARGVLSGIATAMALLPEEFPLVLTLFLALGMWRLARARVLVRQPRAIEMLGTVTTLCVDKTGTLTRNMMTVAELRTPIATCRPSELSKGALLPEEVHELSEFATLASQIDPFDPIDKAVHALSSERLAGTEHVHRDWSLVREYPLTDELLAISCVWRSPGGRELIVASKGAPETILGLCRLAPDQLSRAREQLREMSRAGLRVLGVARAAFPDQELPPGPQAFDFEFIGLLGFADPLRESVPAALRACGAAGVRVIMMTGDHPETARAIAAQAGFSHPERLLLGEELDRLSDLELSSKLTDVDVLARMVPAQKLRVVESLRAAGQVIAMTGDGVNDAPALKWADVGISMGERGTDVAREASDLILLDDDFGSIVRGIGMGRRVYDNLVNAMSYLFAVHVPIAGLAILPVVLGWPLILFPLHIIFLELIIDPASTLLFEGDLAKNDVMSRPPRLANQLTFNWRRIVRASGPGLVPLLVSVVALAWSRHATLSDEQVRSLVFSTLILGNLGLIFANRSFGREDRGKSCWVICGVSVLLAAIHALPQLRRMFQIAPIGLDLWAVAIGAGVATLVIGRASRFGRRLK